MSGLRVEPDGAVRRFVLTRPERGNPLTRELRAALDRELDAACRDGSRVVLLRAAPSERPLFAGGADLADIAALDAAEAPSFAAAGQALFARLETLPMLVLVAVDGPCYGGALDLALAADRLAVSARARFAHPGRRLGIVTGWGGTWRLPQSIGPSGARAAFVTGRAMGSEEALASGLASDELPGDGGEFAAAADAWARDLAERLASVPPDRVADLKRVLAAGLRGRGRLDAAWTRRLAADAETVRAEPSA